MTQHLQQIIDQAWENRSQFSPKEAPAEVRHAVAQVIAYVFSLEGASPMNPPHPKPTVKVPRNMEFSPEGVRVSAEKAAA